MDKNNEKRTVNFCAIREEQMWVLVAPDGFPQPTTLAPDIPSFIGYYQMLEKAGLFQPLEPLGEAGFKILPVKVTIEVDLDELMKTPNDGLPLK